MLELEVESAITVDDGEIVLVEGRGEPRAVPVVSLEARTSGKYSAPRVSAVKGVKTLRTASFVSVDIAGIELDALGVGLVSLTEGSIRFGVDGDVLKGAVSY